jgi:hypothetical protein
MVSRCFESCKDEFVLDVRVFLVLGTNIRGAIAQDNICLPALQLLGDEFAAL